VNNKTIIRTKSNANGVLSFVYKTNDHLDEILVLTK
jgi:hypothetical protein